MIVVVLNDDLHVIYLNNTEKEYLDFQPLHLKGVTGAQYQEYRYGDKTFRLVNKLKYTKLFWRGSGHEYKIAARVCKAFKGSFALASVTSSEEFEFLRSKTYNYHYWIGLDQKAQFNLFVWQDGSEFSYGEERGHEPWAPDAPHRVTIFYFRTIL